MWQSNMCSCPTSSCTRTPPSRSSTAPRCRTSWSAAALELGHERARADRPRQRLRRDGVRAGGEGARPAGAPRRRADARRRPPPDAARRGRARVAQPLPARHARARAHAGGREPGEPGGPAGRGGGPRAEARATGEPGAGGGPASRRAPARASRPAARPARRRARPRRGARLPQRLRDARRPRPRRRCARCATPSGPSRLRVELQRPYLRDDRARNRRLAALARELELRYVATGNVHAHARARAPLQDALVAVRLHTTLDASEPQRRGNFSHVLASPQAMAARFAADHPDAVAETARARRAPALRPHRAPRLPLSRRRGRRRRPQARRVCAARASTSAIRAGQPRCAPRRQRRLEEELRIIARARARPASSCCTATCSSWRARSRVEVRGPDTARALLPPGRGRGSSVSSIVCYLTGLSHVDPIANDLFIGRFLNEELTALPDIDLDFPRDVREALIPRIHERYGARPLRARRGLPDLPRARRDPRAGQGARPAAGGDRARRARLGGLVGARRRAGRREPRSGRSGWRAAAAGRGSRASPTRRTACRATSPSTPAG